MLHAKFQVLFYAEIITIPILYTTNQNQLSSHLITTHRLILEVPTTPNGNLAYP